MSGAAAPCCPVCGARFRGTRECSRCGADLLTLMRIAAQAYRLRAAARRALGAGDPSRAVRSATQAEALHATAAGRRLRRVGELLAAAGRALPAADIRCGDPDLGKDSNRE